jgi:ABC-type bacteriocin/lantibiotic exporter with double-glycine peptidase domain
MRLKGGSTFAVLALCLGGCVTHPTRSIDAFADRSGNNSFEILNRSFASEGLVLPVVQDRQDSAASCGAHALASVINYWTPGATTGDAIYAQTPPADPHGYSLAELQALASRHGLLASSVRMDKAGIIAELEHGRPVLVPVIVPAFFVDRRSVPGANAPVVGVVSSALRNQMARVSEMTHMAMVNHYVVVVGYDQDQFAIVEPVLGFRTITQERLERYREGFQDAALVMSGPHPPGAAQTPNASR